MSIQKLLINLGNYFGRDKYSHKEHAHSLVKMLFAVSQNVRVAERYRKGEVHLMEVNDLGINIVQ